MAFRQIKKKPKRKPISGSFRQIKKKPTVTEKEVAPTKLEPIKLEPTKEADKRPAGKPYYKPTPKPTPSKVAPVIKLEPKEKEKFFDKFNVEKIVEKQTGKDITVKTGMAPGITPVGGVGFLKEAARGLKIAFGGAKKASPATISAAVHAHKLYRTKAGAEKLIGIGTRTATRSFIGQPAKSGVAKLFKIGSKAAPTAARFATNTKSMGLTSKILIGAGLSLGAVSIARDVIGTYPFAAFGKEESLQVTNFPISKLIDRGLLDEAESLVDISDEIINTVPSKIPYKNVLQEFRQYVKAQEKANEGWRDIINFEREKVPEEDKWAKIYEDQEKRRTEQRAADEEYYAGIQDSLANAREEGRAEDERYYAEINEQNKIRKEAADAEELEEMQWKAEYYDLIRQGLYEEAQALLESKVKGGK